MIYVPQNKLKAGMKLAKRVFIPKSFEGEKFVLVEGCVLNNSLISKLKMNGVGGLYIQDNINETLNLKTNVSAQLRTQAINGVKLFFDAVQENPDDVPSETVGSLLNTTNQLVNTIISNKNSLIDIVDIKSYDEFIYHHSTSVAILAIAVGVEMGLPGEQLYSLGIASILHDIGKVFIPLDIINAVNPLSNEALELIKQHPQKGAEFLKVKNYISDEAYDAILTHHEKIDGTGYPNHLKGDQIPLLGKIIATCDVYDALTSIRPYRDPNMPSEAIEYLIGNIGTFFDEQVIQNFYKKVAPYNIGSVLKLSNGRIGIVVKNNKEFPLRPVLRSQGNSGEIETIDLSALEHFDKVVVGYGYG